MISIISHFFQRLMVYSYHTYKIVRLSVSPSNVPLSICVSLLLDSVLKTEKLTMISLSLSLSCHRCHVA